jgi:hypothetical protein
MSKKKQPAADKDWFEDGEVPDLPELAGGLWAEPAKKGCGGEHTFEVTPAKQTKAAEWACTKCGEPMPTGSRRSPSRSPSGRS